MDQSVSIPDAEVGVEGCQSVVISRRLALLALHGRVEMSVR
jgi:hypothetical protein